MYGNSMEKTWKNIEKQWKNMEKYGKRIEIPKKFLEKPLKFPRNFYDNYNVLHSSITHTSS